MTDEQRLASLLPGLASTPFRITSAKANHYNCIAWAAGDTRNWWEPDPMRIYYWPKSAPRQMTIDAYVAAFISVGYEPCVSPEAESGVLKVALYATLNGIPKHAARQLSTGRWTSKLGRDHDIEHELHAIEGNCYGFVVRLLRRSNKSKSS
jgi:hypothetical protein